MPGGIISHRMPHRYLKSRRSRIADTFSIADHHIQHCDNVLTISFLHSRFTSARWSGIAKEASVLLEQRRYLFNTAVSLFLYNAISSIILLSDDARLRIRLADKRILQLRRLHSLIFYCHYLNSISIACDFTHHFHIMNLGYSSRCELSPRAVNAGERLAP